MGVRIDTLVIEHYLTIGTNFSPNTSYALAVGGNTLHNGVVYFANSTTYYINNSALAYLKDIRALKTRIYDNWIGFYSADNAGGNRYGYIQTSQDLMNFVKENGTSGTTPEFRFNGNVQPSATNSYNLGASDKRWKNLYLQGNLVMQDMGTPSSYPATANKITWTGGSDGASIYYKVDAADTGRLFLNMSDDTNALIALSYNDAAKAYFNPSTPSFYPVTTNTGSLGISSSYWGAAYILTLAVSGNATIGGTLTVGGTSTFNGASHFNANMYWKAGVDFVCNGATANNLDWTFVLENTEKTGTWWGVYSSKLGKTLLGVYNDDGHIIMPANIASTNTATGTLQVTGGIGATGQVTALRLAANGSSTSFNLYVNGPSHLNGNVSVTGNITPTQNYTYNLGSGSYYWKGAYIWGDGHIHPALYDANAVGGQKLIFADNARGFISLLYKDAGVIGSKLWDMSAKNITVEYTTNSGTNWAAKTTITNAEDKRYLTMTGSSGIGNIGDTITSNAGTYTETVNGSNVTRYTTHPLRVTGYGVRVTLTTAVSGGSCHWGWLSNISVGYAGYKGTYTSKLETAYYTKNGSNYIENWETIDERTFVTNGSWDNTMLYYLNATKYLNGYYIPGLSNPNKSGDSRYIHKIRMTLICTAVLAADVTQSANRYSGWISRINVFGTGSGADITSNTTYPESSRYQYTMSRYYVPYHIYDYRLGRVQFSTDEIRVYDDLAYIPANTAKWATLILGNSGKQTENSRHAQGRILIYSNLLGYHYIQSPTGNTNGYTTYLGLGTGWLAVGGNGSTTGTGDTNTPIFLNTSGVLTAVTNIKTAVGGTGVTSHTANRLVWSTSATTILATNNHFANASKIAINSTAEPSYNFLVNGTGRFNNILTLYRESTTSSNAPAGVLFTVKDTTTTKLYDSYIYVYQDHAATTYGNNMVINPAGGLFLGGGESASAMYGAKGATYTGEDTFVTADGTTYIYGNANTIANRIGFAVSTSGHILPQKAEAANDNVQNIGADSNAFKDTFTYRLNLDRYKGANRGYVSYYRSSYLTWIDYMSDASNGSAPTGGKPGTLGNVTTWALRSIIENSTNYGWLWEATANSAATANTVLPTARMALSSNTGYLRIAPNASSSTCLTSGLIIDSAANASSGNVAIELWRGNNASWQIANEGGVLYIRSNYTTAVQTTYSQLGIILDYNTGACAIPYLALGQATRNTSYRLYVNGAAWIKNNITIGTKGYGLYLTDGAGVTYCGIRDNGTNLWIGAASSTSQHHKGKTFISSGHNGTSGNSSIYISIPADGNASTTDTEYAIGYRINSGTSTKPCYIDNVGAIRACSYSVSATINAGTANKMAYYSGANAISATALTYVSGGIRQILDDTSNWTQIISWDKTTTYGKSYFPGIGRHNTGDTNGVIQIIPFATNNNPWGNTEGFIIGSTYSLFCSGSFSTPNGNLWAGTDGDTTAERDVGVRSGAGKLYLYSTASATGNRGLYTPAHGDGGARHVIKVDTNNRVYFADSYNGTGTALAYSLSDLAASAITWLACWNGYELRAISKAETFNAVRDNGGDSRWVTLATALTISGVKTFSTELHFSSANGFRLQYSNYGVIFRNDGSDYYFLVTASGEAVNGSWNSLRPFSFNLSSGRVNLGNGVNVGYANTSYTLSTASFICNSWVRTKGSTGWYNEDYGGGWYMTDSSWIKNYGSKGVFLNATLHMLGTSAPNLRFATQDLQDFTLTTNGLTANREAGIVFYNKDTANWVGDFKQGYTKSNGDIWCRMYVRNYKTDGTTLVNNYICCYAKKDGTRTYSVADPAAFRSAIGVGASGTHANDYFVLRSGDTMTGNLTIHPASGAAWTKWKCENTGVSVEMWSDTTNHGIYTRGYWNGSAFVSGPGWLLYRGVDSYLHTSFRLYGAVWNDYAETRASECHEPGRVVKENGKQMILANGRLEAGCRVITDTYGMCIGCDKDIPIAVSGRVLVYPYRNKTNYPLGAAVCSAPGGTIDIMTREEIMMYPERIIGTVSEIPDYDVWYTNTPDESGRGTEAIQVNGRIWIYVR